MQVFFNSGKYLLHGREVIGLLESESGKMVQSASHRVIRNRKWLIIVPVQTALAATIVIDHTSPQVRFEKGLLQFSEIPVAQCRLSAEATTADLDAACITFPLLLRKRKAGDYFYPLGMRKKKKVSRFLSDLKLSVPEKESTWVLESDKSIIWVVGRRIDDRFKVTANTGSVYRFTFTPTS